MTRNAISSLTSLSRRRSRDRIPAALLTCALLAGCVRSHVDATPAKPHFTRLLDVNAFSRGNLHTHSNASDGDAPPADVITAYRNLGYRFVALTDHNKLFDPKRARALSSPSFVVIAGEEVSMLAGGKQVHVNALCTETPIRGAVFDAPIDALRAAISEVNAQGGVALVNHPNFDWALRASDVIAVASHLQLIEIASGHPYVKEHGDGTHPSHEALWDEVLSAGFDVAGVAVDDTHHVRMSGEPPTFAGVAWVDIFSDAATKFSDMASKESVCDALRRGDLIASTGPRLRHLRVTRESYIVEVDGPADRVTFIGANGRILAQHEHVDGNAEYRIIGSEQYVRARIEIGKKKAWTPAIRVQ